MIPASQLIILSRSIVYAHIVLCMEDFIIVAKGEKKIIIIIITEPPILRLLSVHHLMHTSVTAALYPIQLESQLVRCLLMFCDAFENVDSICIKHI